MSRRSIINTDNQALVLLGSADNLLARCRAIPGKSEKFDTRNQEHVLLMPDGSALVVQEADGYEVPRSVFDRLVVVGSRVQAGVGDGYDTGRVDEVSSDGHVCQVSWDSGVRTPYDTAGLEVCS